MDVELARQQWEDGRRRVARAPAESTDSRRLAGQIDLIVSALRRRIGQVYTMDQLAAAYDDANEWARELLYDARTEDEDAPPPDTATVTDAAFQQYARGALDYRP